MDEKLIQEFILIARRIGRLGLVQCSSGNLSWRINDHIMLITATGSWMERLDKEDVAVCKIEDGESLNGISPSVEVGFHNGIFKIRDDVRMVLHFQSPYATAVACIEPSFENFNLIPEIPYYIGSIKRIPFYAPGSSALAYAVVEAARLNNMIIMQNHGLVTMAPDADLLLKRALFFELACKILFIGGKSIKGLSRSQIKDMGI